MASNIDIDLKLNQSSKDILQQLKDLEKGITCTIDLKIKGLDALDPIKALDNKTITIDLQVKNMNQFKELETSLTEIQKSVQIITGEIGNISGSFKGVGDSIKAAKKDLSDFASLLDGTAKKAANVANNLYPSGSGQGGISAKGAASSGFDALGMPIRQSGPGAQITNAVINSRIQMLDQMVNQIRQARVNQPAPQSNPGVAFIMQMLGAKANFAGNLAGAIGTHAALNPNEVLRNPTLIQMLLAQSGAAYGNALNSGRAAFINSPGAGSAPISPLILQQIMRTNANVAGGGAAFIQDLINEQARQDAIDTYREKTAPFSDIRRRPSSGGNSLDDYYSRIAPSSDINALKKAQARFDNLGLLQQLSQRQSIAASAGVDPAFLGANKTLASFIKGKFSGSNFDSSAANLITAVGGGTRGIAGFLGGLGGEFLGGSTGALVGSVGLGAVAGVAGAAFVGLANALKGAAEAGLTFQRSVVGIAGSLQASSTITDINDNPLPIGQQLEFQRKRAEDILIKSRAELLPLGVAGEQESVIVQGILAGASQRGIQLNAAQVATLSRRLGGLIASENPELFNNPGQLRREFIDVVGGTPGASRTILGSLARPQLGGITRAPNASDLIRATDSLEAYVESFNNSPLLATQITRLQGQFENFNINVGAAIDSFPPFVAIIHGVNEYFKILGDKANAAGDALGQIGTFVSQAFGFYKDPELQQIDPSVGIKGLFAQAGISNEEVSKAGLDAELLPELNLNRLKAINRFNNSVNLKGGELALTPALKRLQTKSIIEEQDKLIARRLEGSVNPFERSRISLQGVSENIDTLQSQRSFLDKELKNPSNSYSRILAIQAQIAENEAKINQERVKGYQALEQQVGAVKELADLREAAVADLGVASGSGVSRLGIRRSGLQSQISAQQDLLGTGLNDEIIQARIDALRARVAETDNQIPIAKIQKQLAGINTGTLAGKRQAGFLGIDIAEQSGQITSGLAKQQRESFGINNSLEGIGTVTGLVKSFNDATTALTNFGLETQNTTLQLEEYQSQLGEVADQLELQKAEGAERARLAAKQLLDKGFLLSPEQSIGLQNLGVSQFDLTDEDNLGNELRKKTILNSQLNLALSGANRDRLNNRAEYQTNSLLQQINQGEGFLRNRPLDFVALQAQQAQTAQSLYQLYQGSPNNPFEGLRNQALGRLQSVISPNGEINQTGIDDLLAGRTPNLPNAPVLPGNQGPSIAQLTVSIDGLVTSLKDLITKLDPNVLANTMAQAVINSITTGGKH